MSDNITTNDETPKSSNKKKNGLPGCAWVVIIILPIFALFSLTMMCGNPPEQSRYANKSISSAKINPKNNPQQNVKPKTNVANLNKGNQAKPTLNRIKGTNQSINTSTLNNKPNTKTNNKPNATKNNKPATTPNSISGNSALALQNKANTTVGATQNLKGQNVVTTPPPKQQANTSQKPNNNVNITTNTNNIAKAITPKPKPVAPKVVNTAKPVNNSNTISKYKGSASRVDVAAQTNTTEIINFGTVTNNDKVLTPSAYSNFIKISKILLDNPKATITIRTHNKDFKNLEENQKAKQQGQMRADILKKVLVDSGVAAGRVKVDLIGHIEPLIAQDPTHNRNKRVSVKIN